MQGPKLTNLDTLDILILPHPSDWRINNLSYIAEKRSIKGDNYIDYLGQNKEFVLEYDAYSYNDYQDLITFYNNYFKTGATISFYYDKFPEARNISVSMHISDTQRAGGSGSSGYYSKITITLKRLAAYADH